MTSDQAQSVVSIAQAMVPSGTSYRGAVWIGTVDEQQLLSRRLHLVGLAGYRSVRLLVRSGRTPRGFIELAVDNGSYDWTRAAQAVAALPKVEQPLDQPRPPISVILCTFDRPHHLKTSLRSLLALDYPEFDILIVDNHPASGLTAPVIDALGDSRVRLVEEPRRGLARARNRGALAATHEHLAFTDDDVVLDRYWLQGIADGFAAAPSVACVTGIVPSGEIASASQAYFDHRVSWARNCQREVFAKTARRVNDPLFPFQVGRFGTGANFAMRRSALLALGGFDEGLGVGSRTGGGEDIDMFVRVLLAGHALAYEPSAIVWHKHRADLASLTTQITNYGTGLGAWIAKLALNPRTLPMILRRFVPGILHLRRVTNPVVPLIHASSAHRSLWRLELRAVASGPAALLLARLGGARARPLRSSAASAQAAADGWET